MMNYDFIYHIPSRVYFKTGVSDKIGEYIKELDIKCSLIITDNNISSLHWYKVISENIKNNCNEVIVFNRVHCEPSDEDVNNAIEFAKDCAVTGVIGIGGGSCMDCAKGVAAAISSGSKSITPFLRPNEQKVEKKAKLILIPTTAGTGSEITRGAVLIDKENRIKRGFGNGGYYADVALIDPNLGSTLSKEQIATSGADAFCHALESFLVNQSHPICKIWSLHALKLIWENLPRMYKENDRYSRENMFLGSLLATMSFSTGVGLTFSHHISDILGGIYEIPHGFASYYSLPFTVKIFMKNDKWKSDFEMLETIFGGKNILEALESLSLTLQIPSFEKYFAPMVKKEIDVMYESIMNNSYRATELKGESLYKVIKDSFGSKNEGEKD